MRVIPNERFSYNNAGYILLVSALRAAERAIRLHDGSAIDYAYGRTGHTQLTRTHDQPRRDLGHVAHEDRSSP